VPNTSQGSVATHLRCGGIYTLQLNAKSHGEKTFPYQSSLRQVTAKIYAATFSKSQ